MSARPTVLVLGGGPDAERDVSIVSSRAVAQALMDSGRFEVRYELIGSIGPCDVRAMAGDVVFPVLHGAFGEGGPMQDLLEMDGRAYIGSGPRAARVAMDKVATKLVAAGLGIPTPEAAVVNAMDPVCPIGTPCVVKPVHEGSSVGLMLCPEASAWAGALAGVRQDLAARPDRAWMVERMVRGRELTVAMLVGDEGLEAIGVVEITPAQGVYDYAAKYERDDTRYTVDPGLPRGVDEAIREWASRLCGAIGVRHLARVDFMLDERTDRATLLEVNTMPGFTSHSLLPMAAHARGMGLADLCAHLVDVALGERAPTAGV
ncbi:MAG: D-alanine--D-alanine ligase [Phycisphaerales bacterium]